MAAYREQTHTQSPLLYRLLNILTSTMEPFSGRRTLVEGDEQPYWPRQ